MEGIQIKEVQEIDTANINSFIIEKNFLNHNFKIKNENLKLVEKIDKFKLKIILDNFKELLPKIGDFKPTEQNYKKLTDEKTIKTILENLYNRDDLISYKYSYGSNKQGRVFGKNSLQSISRVIRHTVATNMTDIDIKNAHFIFFQHIAKTLKIPIPHIDYFIERRDNIYKTFMKKLGLSKDQVKRVFLSSLNNGQCEEFYNTNLFKDDTEPCVKFFKKFHLQLQTVVDEIANYNEEFKNDFATALKNKPNNPKGSFINLILCRIENTILHIIADYARLRDIEIATYCFDGFLCYNDNLPNDLTELFHEMEEEVFKIIGIRITLTKKEMDEALDLSSFISKKTEFNVDDKYVQMEHLENPSPIVVVNAFMGFGKSTATVEYMNKHPFKKRIILTPRRTYADSIHDRLNRELKSGIKFEHYNKIKGKRGLEIDMNVYHNVIIQCESLWKLENYIDNDVLVIIDEVESFLTQAVSLETNKDRGCIGTHSKNLYTFSKLLKSKKVLILDAFISSTLKNVLSNLSLDFVLYNYVAEKQRRNFTMLRGNSKMFNIFLFFNFSKIRFLLS